MTSYLNNAPAPLPYGTKRCDHPACHRHTGLSNTHCCTGCSTAHAHGREVAETPEDECMTRGGVLHSDGCR